MTDSKIRLGIREKLFFLILIGFGALILTTFWQIGEQAQRVSNSTINQSLTQSSAILDAKIESRFNSIREVAISIARDGLILPLVYERETLTLQDQSIEFQKKLEFNILFFTDESGNILARSDRPAAIGQNVAGRAPFFDMALAGKSGIGYFKSRGRLMQIVTEPIYDNVVKGLVRGTVALAYELSNETANEIVSLTFSDIGFFSFTRDENRQVNGVEGIYVTDQRLVAPLDNFFAQSKQNWELVFSGASPVQDFQAVLNDEEYFAVTRQIANEGSDPLGFVVILRSRQDLLEPFTRIQNTVLSIGVICLLIAFVLAGFVAFRISKPIRELVSVTNDIRDGKFPEENAAPKSSDEIGVLYRSVVDMGTALKEKADLENYLAQISNEINEDSTSFKEQELDKSSNIDHFLGEAIDQGMPDLSRSDDTVNTNQVGNGGKSKPQSTSFLIAPGTVIEQRYEVVKIIGKGAIGEVFLVHDQELDEKVALKLMPRKLFDANDSISIKKEIRLARRITHRNIVRTFDMGNWNDYTYITMEYVLGYDLDIFLRKRGAQEHYIAMLMGRQICSAMNAAHEQGVIHLDLKPGNMMVNRQGILKIMDFGLARTVGSQTRNDADNKKDKLVGTPRYMAPEQFLNDKLDQRTDVYSIGIILYTLLTGKPPFSHKDYMKIAEMQIHHDLPEISGQAGAVTLERIIRKATAKDPGDRFQTAQEMLESLSKV